MTLAEIVEQAKGLSQQEQKELIKLLVDALAVTESSEGELQREHRFSDLRGLGAEVWQGMDAQEYVDELRNNWDDHQ
jgi:hypothetical protein